MNKIIICDQNKDLIDAIKKAGIKSNYVEIEIIHGDIIQEHEKRPGSRIVTASNPQFSPDGGLDAVLAAKYEWENPYEFKLSKDLFFVKSVNERRSSTEEIIFRALAGLFLHRHQGDFLLPVIGCGIGAFAISKFIEYLDRVLRSADLRSADLSSADLRSADLSSADLRSADLSSADLSSADLRSADLRSADLRSADLSYANLSSTNLSSADLRSANLSSADLRSANLSYANLSSADLSYANLSSADLSSADLRSANLRSADLSSADLSSADLRSADLSYANLRSTNLSSTNLSYADLSSADLRSANLSSANLSYANLRSAKLLKVIYNEVTAFFGLACPSEGSFIAWKKASGCIIRLEIPARAKRSSATSRKCRASSAKVLEIYNGKKKVKSVKSDHDSSFVYTVGKTVKPTTKFDEDRWNECSSGIHFFITREEAENWNS